MSLAHPLPAPRPWQVGGRIAQDVLGSSVACLCYIVLCGDGEAFFSEPADKHRYLLQAVLVEVLSDGPGSLFGQALVVPTRALGIGVACDVELNRD